MTVTTYNFQSYPATTKAVFDCPKCGKKNRQRSFRHECTVNPFNKNADGDVCTPNEVRAQSFARAEQERDEFLTEPLCKKCEDALPWQERSELGRRRRSDPEPMTNRRTKP